MPQTVKILIFQTSKGNKSLHDAAWLEIKMSRMDSYKEWTLELQLQNLQYLFERIQGR